MTTLLAPAPPARACEPCDLSPGSATFECPARMSDGRLFTDYRSRCEGNYLDLSNLRTMNSYAYRQFLMANGEAIMQAQRTAAYLHARCGPCKEPVAQGTMAPEAAVDVCTERVCVRRPGEASGLGLGREYYTDAAEAAARRARMEGELRAQQDELAQAGGAGACCGAPAEPWATWGT